MISLTQKLGCFILQKNYFLEVLKPTTKLVFQVCLSIIYLPFLREGQGTQLLLKHKFLFVFPFISILQGAIIYSLHKKRILMLLFLTVWYSLSTLAQNITAIQCNFQWHSSLLIKMGQVWCLKCGAGELTMEKGWGSWLDWRAWHGWHGTAVKQTRFTNSCWLYCSN